MSDKPQTKFAATFIANGAHIRMNGQHYRVRSNETVCRLTLEHVDPDGQLRDSNTTIEYMPESEIVEVVHVDRGARSKQ